MVLEKLKLLIPNNLFEKMKRQYEPDFETINRHTAPSPSAELWILVPLFIHLRVLKRRIMQMDRI